MSTGGINKDPVGTGRDDKRVIYDFGSNNGDDIPYYLKKGETVVAVEANPVLCRGIEERFAQYITSGRLIVENCVLTTGDAQGDVYFYIHRSNHVLSQFPLPDNIGEFDKVLLPSRSVLEIIARHGQPYYAKIDIEHYDEKILRALLANGVKPPYISAECHSIEVFAVLVTLGGYDSFKLVDGSSVEKKFKDHRISVDGGYERYSFPFHSAGPFGEDIDGEWMNANSFFRLLAFENLGWKDVHATSQHPADAHQVVRMGPYVMRALKRKIGAFIPGGVRQAIKTLVPALDK